MTGSCGMCGREEVPTRHHLNPRTRHHNKRTKRDFGRDAVKETVGLCRPCHKQIHALFSEKELEREWNSLDDLRAHPEVQKFVAWIASKPAGFASRTRAVRR